LSIRHLCSFGGICHLEIWGLKCEGGDKCQKGDEYTQPCAARGRKATKRRGWRKEGSRGETIRIIDRGVSVAGEGEEEGGDEKMYEKARQRRDQIEKASGARWKLTVCCLGCGRFVEFVIRRRGRDQPATGRAVVSPRRSRSRSRRSTKA